MSSVLSHDDMTLVFVRRHPKSREIMYACPYPKCDEVKPKGIKMRVHIGTHERKLGPNAI